MDFSDQNNNVSETLYPLTPTSVDYDPIESLLNKTNFEENGMPSWMEESMPHLPGDMSYEFDDLDEMLSTISTTSTSDSPPASPENPLSPARNIDELSEEELRDMPVKQLNKLLRGESTEKIKKIRQKRRCLKNRGYAQSCRAKRVKCKANLETQVKRLMRELSRMRTELEKTKKERDGYYKALHPAARR